MQKLPPKKDVLNVLLERSTVFVHLDPRRDDVVVPPGFKKEPRLVLQIGHGMAVPIPDLTVTEDGWSGTLSFRQVPFRCVVPWPAVFAMAGEDGRWLVWPEDVPAELIEKPKPQLAVAPAPPPDASAKPDGAAKAEKKPRKKRGKKAEAADAAEAVEAAPPSAALREVPAEAAAPAAGPPPAPPAPSAAPADQSPPSAGPPKSAKPKRELPPYLRVVK